MNTVVLENVSKEIKRVSVLENINMCLETGKIYGLYGHNGSGKTMMLRLIAGLIRPTQGRVIIEGKELHKDIDFPESVGAIIEYPDFWSNYTGIEILKMLAGIKKEIDEPGINHAMQRVGLEPTDKRTIRKYSLGMKQRLGIAQAIMEKPRLLLLDEPTNALDKRGLELAQKIIAEEKERGATVVIASHDAYDIDLCDMVFEMDDGKIVKDEY